MSVFPLNLSLPFSSKQQLAWSLWVLQPVKHFSVTLKSHFSSGVDCNVVTSFSLATSARQSRRWALCASHKYSLLVQLKNVSPVVRGICQITMSCWLQILHLLFNPSFTFLSFFALARYKKNVAAAPEKSLTFWLLNRKTQEIIGIPNLAPLARALSRLQNIGSRVSPHVSSLVLRGLSISELFIKLLNTIQRNTKCTQPNSRE